ncbi:nicotinic acid phosphoribosyltransferase [Peribacillus cavernae]|nr:nicotinic acid phosphoribosyltransferase [Peribacillus cavernae]
MATNVYNVVKAAAHSGIQKPVIFMGDRDDHFTQQAGDGYAAYIGGATAQATHAMNEWWGKKGMGRCRMRLFSCSMVTLWQHRMLTS